MTPTLTAKVQKFIQRSLSGEIEDCYDLLMKGKMLEREKELQEFINKLYDEIMEVLLNGIGPSSLFRQKLKGVFQNFGFRQQPDILYLRLNPTVRS